MSLKFDMKFELPPGLEEGEVERAFDEIYFRCLESVAILTRNTMTLTTPFGGTGNTGDSWQLVNVTKTGDKYIAGATTNNVAALVIEDGAKPHRPPSARLETWVRRGLPRVATPFIPLPGGGRRDADLSDPDDVAAIAIKISDAIAARGLPRPGVSTGVFSKAFDSLGQEITRILNDCSDEVARRIAR